VDATNYFKEASSVAYQAKGHQAQEGERDTVHDVSGPGRGSD